MAKVSFTAGKVSGFKCPPDKKQAFLWDATAHGLGLRATPAGKPAYVFQAEYQGKPSATAEKHYRVRPLDLLRVHHEKLEAWILEQAGVQFDSASEPGKLRVVA